MDQTLKCGVDKCAEFQLWHAASTRNLTSIQARVGTSAIGYKDKRGVTALHLLAAYGDLASFYVMDEEITAKDKKGNTALHYASEHNNVGNIHYLITNRSMEPDATNKFGRTPIDTAVQYSKRKSIVALVYKGARKWKHGQKAPYDEYIKKLIDIPGDPIPEKNPQNEGLQAHGNNQQPTNEQEKKWKQCWRNEQQPNEPQPQGKEPVPGRTTSKTTAPTLNISGLWGEENEEDARFWEELDVSFLDNSKLHVKPEPKIRKKSMDLFTKEELAEREAEWKRKLEEQEQKMRLDYEKKFKEESERMCQDCEHKILLERESNCEYRREELYDLQQRCDALELEMRLCKICMEGEANILLDPCSHITMCGNCTKQLMDSNKNQCPHCRANFTSYKKVFIA